jgi:hypothetical protein
VELCICILVVDGCSKVLELLGNPVATSFMGSTIHGARAKSTLGGYIGIGRVFTESGCLWLVGFGSDRLFATSTRQDEWKEGKQEE